MVVARRDSVALQAEEDVVRTRQAVRRWTTDLGFSLVDQTKMVTAASEIGRNTVIYGGGGVMEIEVVQSETRQGLRLTFIDQGPGIPDISLALRDGYTTGSGLGLGLGGAKRLVNDFQIESRPGHGTRIVLVRWR